MDEKRFWDIIGFACKPDDDVEWQRAISEQLERIDSDELVRFDRFIVDRADALFTQADWLAASLIDGEQDDDSFFCFRCWVVGMGRRVYEMTLDAPDSLADVIAPLTDAGFHQAPIFDLGHDIWSQRGLPAEEYERRYRLPPPRFWTPIPNHWFFDLHEARRHLPRLTAIRYPDNPP